MGTTAQMTLYVTHVQLMTLFHIGKIPPMIIEKKCTVCRRHYTRPEVMPTDLHLMGVRAAVGDGKVCVPCARAIEAARELRKVTI